MSNPKKIASFVERIELNRHLVVVRLAMRVVVLPAYSSQSPPTVRRTQLTLVLLGQRVGTRRPYVIFLPVGILDGWTKGMVLLPLMQDPMPWARRPMSFTRA